MNIALTPDEVTALGQWARADRDWSGRNNEQPNEVVQGLWVKVQEVLNRQHNAALTQQCVTAGCIRVRDTRGLCKTCYQFQYSQVEQQKTTWAQLESRGMSLPRIKLRIGERQARQRD